jgi:hypothetical protein
MSLLATAANAAWCASSVPSYLAFRAALANPRRVQLDLLRRYVGRNADTAFGREHGFASIRDLETFRSRVPVRGYDEIAPWIDRITAGEQRVLTADRVTRLIPSSGSTRAAKLIPYTAELQREFNRAIGPWIVDLYRNTPGLMRGPAYWSISPVSKTEEERHHGTSPSAVPIGFDEDSAYLGGIRQRLVDAVMAVPASVRHSPDVRSFQDATLLHLLRRRDLRLISVWHPSFLELLLDAAAERWDALLGYLGQDDAARAAELRATGPRDWRVVWPRLALVSCWADANAAGPADALRRRVPDVPLQPKGLLATEAFVSIPFAGRWPLAVRSHFMEFENDAGRLLTADELTPGGTYGVIVTTGGGLWRYKLGDRVRCDDMLAGTPSVRFVGRSDLVVDLVGEKLNEGFVGGVVRAVLAGARVETDFAMLAPDTCGGPAASLCYTLFIAAACGDRATVGRVLVSLDVALRANPHYAYCRDLGQLGPPRLFRIRGDAYATYVAAATRSGRRMGDVKPVALHAHAQWSTQFQGEYADSDGS